MEFLKEALGDELYSKVAEKLKDSKIKLADLSGGAYVGKEKFDAVSEQLRTAQETLKGFNGKTIDQVNAEVADWKQKAEKVQQDADARIATIEFDAALNTALSGARAKNPKAVAALLNRDALKLVDGAIVGLKEQIDTVRKDNAFLFDVEPAGGAGFSGKQPPSAQGTGTSETMNSILRGGANGS